MGVVVCCKCWNFWMEALQTLFGCQFPSRLSPPRNGPFVSSGRVGSTCRTATLAFCESGADGFQSFSRRWNLGGVNHYKRFACVSMWPERFPPWFCNKKKHGASSRFLSDALRLEAKKKELEKKMLAEAKVQLPKTWSVGRFLGTIFSLKLTLRPWKSAIHPFPKSSSNHCFSGAKLIFRAASDPKNATRCNVF